jgi:hypothetical protein
MKSRIVFALVALALISGLVSSARASVESSRVEAKALYELLYSMESNGTKGVTSQQVAIGDFTVTTITLGKAPNSLSCKQSISATRDSIFYDCNVKKEITLPTTAN